MWHETKDGHMVYIIDHMALLRTEPLTKEQEEIIKQHSQKLKEMCKGVTLMVNGKEWKTT